MTIESAVMVRRVALVACLILIIGFLFSGAAAAQLPVQGPVPVTVGAVVPFHHGSTGTWSQIYSMKFTPNGTLLFLDSAASNIYQLAPGASEPTLLIGPAAVGANSDGSTLEAAGTYWNAAIAIDSNNTLYVTDRYGSAVHFLRVPYKNGTWTFSSATNWATSPSIVVNGAPTAIMPQDLAIGDDGTFYVSWSNTGEIDKFTVDASGTPGTVTRVITGMQTMSSNIAVDHAGNLFFIENAYAAPGSRVTGIREIPANATLPLQGDASGSLELSLRRIDPLSEGLNGIKGMTFDPQGNMYVSTANNSSYGGNVSGVFMLPNEGTPKAPNLVWSDLVMISPVYAGFPVAIDPRGYLWIPGGGGGNNFAPSGSLSTKCDTTDNKTINATCTSSSVILWAMGSANVGDSLVGTGSTPQTIFYNFGQPMTPASFSFALPGGKNFSLVDNPNADPTSVPPVPPCTAGTAYPGFTGMETTVSQFSWCTAFVQVTPTAVGSVSAELQILDANKNAVAGSTIYLSGIGQGSAASVLSPIAQQATASGLRSPRQVAADAWGNSYVADSALKAIEFYPAGSNSVIGSALGTGLTAPTGVAVDGAGDLYIGDSGKVIEIPFINGALAPKQQTTLITGLGSHLNLAVDGLGQVFVADADKAQIVKITNPEMAIVLQGQPLNTLKNTSGTWTAPSAIATDNSGDVFVADGSNLWEISPMGGASEITGSLSAPVTGLAVDPSGSVFVSESTGLWWIPVNPLGGLNTNGAIQVASGVGPAGTAVPLSVGLDGMQNAFVTFGSGTTAGMAQLGVSGSVDFGQIVPFLENDQETQIANLGNTPLTLSPFAGDVFTGANAADYSVGVAADSPACDPTNPTPAGSACFFDLALTPAAAGASSASVAVLSDAVNASSLNIALMAQAVPDDRMPTTTAITLDPSTGAVYPGAETVTVTVTSPGNGTPTGSVVLSVSGQAKQTQPLVDGVATFSYTNLLGGTYNLTADYGGDGAAGATSGSCAADTSCFAVSAAKSSFIIVTAKPTETVAAPAGAVVDVTTWAGNTYVNEYRPDSITATVTSSVGIPTGTVSFLQNGKPVDPAQATIPLDANGNATFSTANLLTGVYNLTVVYNGDVNYSVVSTAIPTFEVITPSIQVTANPATTTLKAGTPGPVTLILKPLVGFTGNVKLQCVNASLPEYSECTFAYPPGSNGVVGVGYGSDPTATSSIVVTISTNVPVNGTTSSSQSKPAPWSLAGIFGLGLLGLIAGRKKLNRYLTIACLGLMFSGAFLGITACTNSGYSTPPPAPKVTTPAGTYNVQIITVDPSNGQQNSITAPLFVLPTTVQ
jgi:hypothetical protein